MHTRLILVHLLEVGDGKPPAESPSAKIELDQEAVRLLLNDQAYSFSAAAPFDVSLSRP
jgi:hypothetical protein